MMQIVYFSQKGQLWQELKRLPGELVFITPSPAKADSLRVQLGAQGLHHDVVTIAKFTGSLVESLWDDPAERPQVKRKADLLLIFGILKNKYLPELGYEQFMQGYNLFSDLRSFTMDEDALSTVLEEQPQEIRKAVSLFWQLLGTGSFLDEHGAYHQISEKLRSGEENAKLKKTFVFSGFQHLNGQQVDLLKALSIRYPVVVPFPLALKNSLKRSDWISWLLENKVSEQILESEVPVPRADWIKVNSRELSRTLKHLLKDGDQVVLGVSKLEPLHLDVVPSTRVSFKVPHELVGAEIKQLVNLLKQEFRGKHDLKDLKDLLESQKKRLLKKHDGLKKLKAIQLFEESLLAIDELTDEPPALDSFFLKLLSEVVTLNQPRTSFVPFSPRELTLELRDMSSMEDIDRSRPVYLCIDERFDDIQGLGQSYTEAIQKALSNLGPLKRNELELQFKAWELRDLLSHGQVTVLMSENARNHSLVWNRLFSAPVELNDRESVIDHRERRLQDHFQAIAKKTFTGHFSATKFQSFVDCPRRFYFSYVDQIFPSVGLKQDFDALGAGTIAHEIIEVYHKRGLAPEALGDLTREIMQKFIHEEKLLLPRETYLKREPEFNHRARNGINFLIQLKEVLGENIVWRMEEKFDFTDTHKVVGKIDCTGESPETVLLIDFKSTGASVPSKKDILSFDSLQLWTYAQAASRNIAGFAQKNVILGFVSLDKPTDSRLLLSSGEHLDLLKVAKIAKLDVFPEEFPELLRQSQEKMGALALAISAETNFPANPRSPKACHFCELTKVCVKSTVSHE